MVPCLPDLSANHCCAARTPNPTKSWGFRRLFKNRLPGIMPDFSFFPKSRLEGWRIACSWIRQNDLAPHDMPFDLREQVGAFDPAVANGDGECVVEADIAELCQ